MAFRVTPERLLDLAAFLLLTPGFIAAIFGDHNSERLSEALGRARSYLAPSNVASVARRLVAKSPLGAVLEVCVWICFWLFIAYEIVETVRAIYLGSQKPPVTAHGFAGLVQQLKGLPVVPLVELPIPFVVVTIVVYTTGPAFFLMLGTLLTSLRQGPRGEAVAQSLLGNLFELLMGAGCGGSILGFIFGAPALVVLILAYCAASLVISTLLWLLQAPVGAASLLTRVRWRRIAFLVGVVLYIYKDVAF